MDHALRILNFFTLYIHLTPPPPFPPHKLLQVPSLITGRMEFHSIRNFLGRAEDSFAATKTDLGLSKARSLVVTGGQSGFRRTYVDVNGVRHVVPAAVVTLTAGQSTNGPPSFSARFDDIANELDNDFWNGTSVCRYATASCMLPHHYPLQLPPPPTITPCLPVRYSFLLPPLPTVNTTTHFGFGFGFLVNSKALMECSVFPYSNGERSTPAHVRTLKPRTHSPHHAC